MNSDEILEMYTLFPQLLEKRLKTSRKSGHFPSRLTITLVDIVAKTGDQYLQSLLDEKLDVILSDCEVHGASIYQASDALEELSDLAALYHGREQYVRISELIRNIMDAY